MITEHGRGDAPDCAYPPHPPPPGDAGWGNTVVAPPSRPATVTRPRRAGWAAVPAVWAAAEIMHAARTPGWGPALVTAAVAVAAFGAGEYRARRRKHPVLEGTEMATAVAVPGVWLATATVLGPLWGPYDLMTSVIYLTVMVGGWQWLKRREAFRSAQARRSLAAVTAAREAAEEAAWLAKKIEWHRLAPKVGLQGSDLLAAGVNKNGSETWTVDTYGAGTLAGQVHARTVAHQLSGEKLEMAGWHPVPMNRIEVTPDADMAYHLLITFRQEDLWQGGTDLGLNWHPLASGQLDPASPYAAYFGAAPSILDPVPLLTDPETGEVGMLTLYDEDGGRRVLVLGTSGSGKTMILDTLRERVTACRDAVPLQINLSKGVEDAWWEQLTAASALASVHGPEAEARALRILDFIHDVVNTGRPRKPGQRTHKPTPGEPAFVVFIDEVDMTANDEDRKHQLGQIASKCRSEGAVLIVGSQRPQDIYVGGGMVRSNLSDLVWGALRENDRRQAGGSYGAEIPDMTDYGGGLPGVFGIAPLPLGEGMPVFKGRGFFWGKDSAGLISIISGRIAARGGKRPYQVLEAGLAARFGEEWAEITGAGDTPAVPPPAAVRPAATPPPAATTRPPDRYDIKRARDGSTVPTGAGVQRKLDATQAIIDTELDPGLRARMEAGVPDGQREAEKTEAITADHLPPEGQDALWVMVSGPEGISGRDAARKLERIPGCSRYTVTNQLRAWEAAGKVERTGSGRADTRWQIPGAAGASPRLHAVPPAAGAELSVDEQEMEIPDLGQFEQQDAGVMVGFISLQGGRDHAIRIGRMTDIPDPVIVYGLHLADTEPAFVRAKARRILDDAGARGRGRDQ